MPKQVILGTCPSKSNSYRIVKVEGHSSLAKTPAMKAYEDSFYIQCGQYRDANIEGYFKIHVDVYYPSQRSDLDNAMKVILDILQRKVHAIKNDNKCTEIIARKFVDKERPRIEFELFEVE